ncbi:hypothetical protein ACQKWADRAFT_244058 [Trichoderma austrokoningii]
MRAVNLTARQLSSHMQNLRQELIPRECASLSHRIAAVSVSGNLEAVAYAPIFGALFCSQRKEPRLWQPMAPSKSFLFSTGIMPQKACIKHQTLLRIPRYISASQTKASMTHVCCPSPCLVPGQRGFHGVSGPERIPWTPELLSATIEPTRWKKTVEATYPIFYFISSCLLHRILLQVAAHVRSGIQPPPTSCAPLRYWPGLLHRLLEARLTNMRKTFCGDPGDPRTS